MNVAQIKNDASKHVALCMCVFVAILCIARCVMSIAKMGYSLSVGLPLGIAFVFAVIETILITLLWMRTAVYHIDRMPTFHTASSGFRLLAALVVLLVAYIIVGRENILPYFAWLMLYYFAALVLHSVFFSRENNKIFDESKK